MVNFVIILCTPNPGVEPEFFYIAKPPPNMKFDHFVDVYGYFLHFCEETKQRSRHTVLSTAKTGVLKASKQSTYVYYAMYYVLYPFTSFFVFFIM